jgi:hypothetical protein
MRPIAHAHSEAKTRSQPNYRALLSCLPRRYNSQEYEISKTIENWQGNNKEFH